VCVEVSCLGVGVGHCVGPRHCCYIICNNVVGSCLYVCAMCFAIVILMVLLKLQLNFRVKALLLSPNASNNGKIAIDPSLMVFSNHSPPFLLLKPRTFRAPIGLFDDSMPPTKLDPLTRIVVFLPPPSE